MLPFGGRVGTSFAVLLLLLGAASCREHVEVQDSEAWRVSRVKQLMRLASETQKMRKTGDSAHPARADLSRLLADMGSTNASGGAVGPPRPFKIQVEYAPNIESAVTPEELSHLKDKIMPTLLALVKRFMRVRHPVRGNLVLPPICLDPTTTGPCSSYTTTCGSLDLPLDYFDPSVGTGAGVDADFVLMVGANSADAPASSCAGTTLAWGLSCSWDTATNRPVAGEMFFCRLNPSDLMGDLESALHELMHALGFGSPTWDEGRTVDATGKAGSISSSQVIQKGPPAYIITPNVKRVAQAHFNCPSLPGGELEDDSGDMAVKSLGEHWEERIYDGELMDASAESQTFSGAHVLTNLTLGFMSDTGWYDVDFSKAGYNSWGENGGCALATGSSYQDVVAANPDDSRYLCNPSSNPLQAYCNSDNTAIGICMTKPRWDGFYVVKEDPFNMQPCLAPSTQSYSTFYTGLYSRCIPTATGASCLETRCRDGALSVIYNQVPILCPSGSNINVPNFGTITCPDNTVLCGSTCPNDCSAHGDCLDGICRCHNAYVGADCSSFICTSDASCTQGQVCGDDGECRDAPPDPSTGVTCLVMDAASPLPASDPSNLTTVSVSASGAKVDAEECAAACKEIYNCKWTIMDGSQCVLQAGGFSNWKADSFQMTNARGTDSTPSNVNGVEWYDDRKGISPQDCVNACLLAPSCSYVEAKWAGCRLYNVGTESAATAAPLTGPGTWFDITGCVSGPSQSGPPVANMLPGDVPPGTEVPPAGPTETPQRSRPIITVPSPPLLPPPPPPEAAPVTADESGNLQLEAFGPPTASGVVKLQSAILLVLAVGFAALEWH